MGLNVLFEKTTTGKANYIYGPTGNLAKIVTINGESCTYYYHTDHLGSIRLITDENGDIVVAAMYHPFGEPCVKEGLESFLYTGKEQDNTGLYYYGARYYDPEIGRFVTQDVRIGNKHSPQTLNRFTYCLNNPLKYVDPDGNGEKFSYLKTNPNPIRVTTKNFLSGLFVAGAGLIVLASILIPVLAPVAVSTTIELSGWIQAGSLSVTVFAGLTLCEMHTWLEDVDGDGEWEQVVKVLLPDMKGYYLYHIEEDGAMYLYKCDQYGNKEMKWILVPNPDYPDGYKIYVWDEETSTYLPDQDKDGVPDSPEDQGASEETDAHGGGG